MTVSTQPFFTTEQVAHRMKELCLEGNFLQAQKELYADDARSVEPGNVVVEGLEKIHEKGGHFAENFDVHGVEVSDPMISGKFFAMKIIVDVTHKPSGQRFPMDEIAVYEVENGKVIMEQFFFPGEPG